MDPAWSETGDSWDCFIGGLKERGLRGVRLVTSDDHHGMHPAIKKHYLGAVWQRCQHHFTVNVMYQISEDYQEKYPDLADYISEHAWETLGEDWAYGRIYLKMDLLEENTITVA